MRTIQFYSDQQTVRQIKSVAGDNAVNEAISYLSLYALDAYDEVGMSVASNHREITASYFKDGKFLFMMGGIYRDGSKQFTFHS